MAVNMCQKYEKCLYGNDGTYACILHGRFNNAPVICNHAPIPGAGLGIAGEMSRVFTFQLSPQCQVNAVAMY